MNINKFQHLHYFLRKAVNHGYAKSSIFKQFRTSIRNYFAAMASHTIAKHGQFERCVRHTRFYLCIFEPKINLLLFTFLRKHHPIRININIQEYYQLMQKVCMIMSLAFTYTCCKWLQNPPFYLIQEKFLYAAIFL